MQNDQRPWKTSLSDHTLRSSPSPSRHIAHLLVQSILKQSRPRSFASVNPSRKQKNVPTTMINRSSFTRFTTFGSPNRMLRLKNEHTYERESIIVQVTSRRNAEGYPWKRITWITREPHGKTVKNVVIGGTTTTTTTGTTWTTVDSGHS